MDIETYKRRSRVKLLFIFEFIIHMLWLTLEYIKRLLSESYSSPDFCPPPTLSLHNEPRKAFYNYYKNAVVYDYIVHTQILRWKNTAHHYCGNNDDRLIRFFYVLKYRSMGALSYEQPAFSCFGSIQPVRSIL